MRNAGSISGNRTRAGRPHTRGADKPARFSFVDVICERGKDPRIFSASPEAPPAGSMCWLLGVALTGCFCLGLIFFQFKS